MCIDVGSISSWVAVGTATVAVIFAGLAWKRERKRDESKELNERKAQAERVGAWLHQYRPEIGHVHYAIWYRNASGLPVYDVDLKVVSQRDGAVIWPRKLKLFEPNDAPQEIEIEAPAADVEIGTTVDQELVNKDGKWSGVELIFRDSAGVRWHRDSFGVLKEIKELPDSTTA